MLQNYEPHNTRHRKKATFYINSHLLLLDHYLFLWPH